jgi:hypoxanthine phosphoribosyltransferase
MHRDILFTPDQIAAKVKALAHAIAASKFTPHIAAPILVGGYVFAADLLRALTEEGYSLPTDFLWLRSYVGRESAKTMRVLVPPSENFRGRNVLLIDAVLDSGLTLKKARELALQYGASDVLSVVMVDKGLPGALAKADFTGFTGCDAYIVGYGMDDTGADRALPYIAKAK